MQTQILHLLNDIGVEAYLVGGAVRDTLLGKQPKDFDIEVYGISYDNLADRVSAFGDVDFVGKSFGILKLYANNGEEYDLSLPRIESRIGVGHTGFQVEFDENIKPYDACRRRDFTINAMLMDKDGNIIDFFNGRRHLRQRILVPTSSAFMEDTLRVLRGMQFASRYNLYASSILIEFARHMKDDYHNLSVDRIRIEWLKWATGAYPANGIRLLRDCGWLDLYPQIYNLQFCQQNPKYHAEGDVFTHTLMVLDESNQCNAVLNFAALCHDFGKVTYTVVDENGSISSPGHSDPQLTLEFCQQIGLSEEMTNRVAALVREHMFSTNDVTPRTVRRLLTRINPEDFETLCDLMRCDRLGKIPVGNIDSINHMSQVYSEIGGTSSIQPIVMGRHLIAAGFTPSKQFGMALNAAFQAQIDGEQDFDRLLEIASNKLTSG